MKFIPFFVMCSLVSTNVMAEINSEKEQWYIAQNGMYVVRGGNIDEYYAQLEFNKAYKLNVYIMKLDSACENSDEKVIDHNPLYVNGKLVKYSHACSEGWRTFFPASDAGQDYIIDEFMKKNSVEVSTMDNNFKVMFSAKGFKVLYDKKLLMRKAQQEAI